MSSSTTAEALTVIQKGGSTLLESFKRTIGPIALGKYMAQHMPDTSLVVARVGRTPVFSTVQLETRHDGSRYEINLQYIPCALQPLHRTTDQFELIGDSSSSTVAHSADNEASRQTTTLIDRKFPSQSQVNDNITWTSMAHAYECNLHARLQHPAAFQIIRSILQDLPYQKLAGTPGFGGVRVAYGCERKGLMIANLETARDPTTVRYSYLITIRSLPTTAPLRAAIDINRKPVTPFRAAGQSPDVDTENDTAVMHGAVARANRAAAEHEAKIDVEIAAKGAALFMDDSTATASVSKVETAVLSNTTIKTAKTHVTMCKKSEKTITSAVAQTTAAHPKVMPRLTVRCLSASSPVPQSSPYQIPKQLFASRASSSTPSLAQAGARNNDTSSTGDNTCTGYFWSGAPNLEEVNWRS
jgi:hypothetical protein